MSLPTGRAAQTARRATVALQPSLPLRYLPRAQRRAASYLDPFGAISAVFGKKKASTPLSEALTEREKQNTTNKLTKRITDRRQGKSIFDEEINESEKQQRAQQQPAMGSFAGGRVSTMKEHMQHALDPDPRWRVRYQRKKLMQMVRNDGKLSRKDQLKLDEKEIRCDSTPLPTSTKKLMFLSRQIAGKTLEDAITQMRFSKKKMAREVRFTLEEARNKAIASRGMGLGKVNGEVLKEPKKIVTKDGQKMVIYNPTQLYVDESWVTKGQMRGMRIQYHARSRMSRMWRPSARLSVVLKEEKTRIRMHDDRVEKERKKAPWVHLPNRPVTAQRPYYSW
ncbi:ribosomal protein L22/L17 [Xylariaceae sp. FL1272]|nr:ribosomal protein L22/L17 [Xylariaceae sp. FL1272]